MAATLEGSIEARIAVKYINDTTTGKVTSEVAAADGLGAWTITSGTTADKADLLYDAEISLAAAGTSTLDLETLTDRFGVVVDFARIKALHIKAEAGKDSGVIIGGAVANEWLGFLAAAGDKVKIRSGGWLSVGAPDATAYVVTTTTSTDLLLAHDGAGSDTILVKIYLIGASA